jgi:hypothetical protein
MADPGQPIAYMALAVGTSVETADGVEVGRVKRVLADAGTDIFDGLVVVTDDGDRFVDAPEVDRIYEMLVVLTLSHAEISELSEPSPAPGTMRLGPDDIAGDTTGGKLRDVARRTWDRLSGNY